MTSCKTSLIFFLVYMRKMCNLMHFHSNQTISVYSLFHFYVYYIFHIFFFSEKFSKNNPFKNALSETYINKEKKNI